MTISTRRLTRIRIVLPQMMTRHRMTNPMKKMTCSVKMTIRDLPSYKKSHET